MYDSYDIDNNIIGDRGCEYLSKSKWQNLKCVSLRFIVLIQNLIELVKKAVTSYQWLRGTIWFT